MVTTRTQAQKLSGDGKGKSTSPNDLVESIATENTKNMSEKEKAKAPASGKKATTPSSDRSWLGANLYGLAPLKTWRDLHDLQERITAERDFLTNLPKDPTKSFNGIDYVFYMSRIQTDLKTHSQSKPHDKNLRLETRNLFDRFVDAMGPVIERDLSKLNRGSKETAEQMSAGLFEEWAVPIRFFLSTLQDFNFRKETSTLREKAQSRFQSDFMGPLGEGLGVRTGSKQVSTYVFTRFENASQSVNPLELAPLSPISDPWDDPDIRLEKYLVYLEAAMNSAKPDPNFMFEIYEIHMNTRQIPLESTQIELAPLPDWNSYPSRLKIRKLLVQFCGKFHKYAEKKLLKLQNHLKKQPRRSPCYIECVRRGASQLVDLAEVWQMHDSFDDEIWIETNRLTREFVEPGKPNTRLGELSKYWLHIWTILKDFFDYFESRGKWGTKNEVTAKNDSNIVKFHKLFVNDHERIFRAVEKNEGRTANLSRIHYIVASYIERITTMARDETSNYWHLTAIFDPHNASHITEKTLQNDRSTHTKDPTKAWKTGVLQRLVDSALHLSFSASRPQYGISFSRLVYLYADLDLDPQPVVSPGISPSPRSSLSPSGKSAGSIRKSPSPKESHRPHTPLPGPGLQDKDDDPDAEDIGLAHTGAEGIDFSEYGKLTYEENNTNNEFDPYQYGDGGDQHQNTSAFNLPQSSSLSNLLQSSGTGRRLGGSEAAGDDRQSSRRGNEHGCADPGCATGRECCCGSCGCGCQNRGGDNIGGGGYVAHMPNDREDGNGDRTYIGPGGNTRQIPDRPPNGPNVDDIEDLLNRWNEDINRRDGIRNSDQALGFSEESHARLVRSIQDVCLESLRAQYEDEHANNPREGSSRKSLTPELGLPEPPKSSPGRSKSRKLMYLESVERRLGMHTQQSDLNLPETEPVRQAMSDEITSDQHGLKVPITIQGDGGEESQVESQFSLPPAALDSDFRIYEDPLERGGASGTNANTDTLPPVVRQLSSSIFGRLPAVPTEPLVGQSPISGGRLPPIGEKLKIDYFEDQGLPQVPYWRNLPQADRNEMAFLHKNFKNHIALLRGNWAFRVLTRYELRKELGKGQVQKTRAEVRATEKHDEQLAQEAGLREGQGDWTLGRTTTNSRSRSSSSRSRPSSEGASHSHRGNRAARTPVPSSPSSGPDPDSPAAQQRLEYYPELPQLPGWRELPQHERDEKREFIRRGFDEGPRSPGDDGLIELILEKTIRSTLHDLRRQGNGRVIYRAWEVQAIAEQNATHNPSRAPHRVDGSKPPSKSSPLRSPPRSTRRSQRLSPPRAEPKATHQQSSSSAQTDKAGSRSSPSRSPPRSTQSSQHVPRPTSIPTPRPPLRHPEILPPRFHAQAYDLNTDRYVFWPRRVLNRSMHPNLVRLPPRGRKPRNQPLRNLHGNMLPIVMLQEKKSPEVTPRRRSAEEAAGAAMAGPSENAQETLQPTVEEDAEDAQQSGGSPKRKRSKSPSARPEKGGGGDSDGVKRLRRTNRSEASGLVRRSSTAPSTPLEVDGFEDLMEDYQMDPGMQEEWGGIEDGPRLQRDGEEMECSDVLGSSEIESSEDDDDDMSGFVTESMASYTESDPESGSESFSEAPVNDKLPSPPAERASRKRKMLGWGFLTKR